jgi:hypothetical protein
LDLAITAIQSARSTSKIRGKVNKKPICASPNNYHRFSARNSWSKGKYYICAPNPEMAFFSRKRNKQFRRKVKIAEFERNGEVAQLARAQHS